MKHSWIFLIVALALVCFLYVYQLGENPCGFFCDEALYGLRSYQLWQGNISSLVSPFFYEHFGYLQGTLFIYAPLPFVKLLGLSEYSVRLTAVFFGLLTLMIVWATLRCMKVRYPWVPVLIFGVTPIIIHISRIYFGMTPSMFFMAAGYYLYVRSRINGRSASGFVSGLIMGVSIYGYSAFQVSVLLLFIAIVITEVLYNRLRMRHYKVVACLCLGLMVAYLPLGCAAVKEPGIFKRLHEKHPSFTHLNAERVEQWIRNYPKYYSPAYLFFKGETGMPGAFIYRHSVTDAGLLLQSSMGLIVLAFINVFIVHDKRLRHFLPLFFLIFLYPVPDLITTTEKNAPYTFSVSGSFILLPFVFAYGWKLLVSVSDFFKKKHAVVGYVLLGGMAGICILEAGLFYSNQYQRYPQVSADFWGWQAGPRELIAFFASHSEEYDDFYMQGVFNEPLVFLDFYLVDSPLRKRAFVGSPPAVPIIPKRLFAISDGELKEQAYAKSLRVVHTLHYPNGNPSFHLVTGKQDHS
jgi:4-amino-4-deoxy-L-arabinose transferase-like glycosyltransferase